MEKIFILKKNKMKIKHKNIICYIAARKGSKRVPEKNIRMIGGKPLIAHTIKNALDSKLFDHVVVSTEDKDIALIAKKFGAVVPFLRPKKLASDTVRVRDVLVHDIKKLSSLGYNFDMIVVRDCTAPFIRNKDIEGSINLLKKSKCNTVVAVYKQHFNPYFNIVEIKSDGFLKLSKKRQSVKIRQEAPLVYQLNGLLVFYVDKFLKYATGPSIIPKTLPYEIPIETGLMIDTEFEFKIAEMIFQEKLNTKKD